MQLGPILRKHQLSCGNEMCNATVQSYLDYARSNSTMMLELSFIHLLDKISWRDEHVLGECSEEW
jgi:hypothetical protein